MIRAHLYPFFDFRLGNCFAIRTKATVADRTFAEAVRPFFAPWSGDRERFDLLLPSIHFPQWNTDCAVPTYGRNQDEANLSSSSNFGAWALLAAEFPTFGSMWGIRGPELFPTHLRWGAEQGEGWWGRSPFPSSGELLLEAGSLHFGKESLISALSRFVIGGVL